MKRVIKDPIKYILCKMRGDLLSCGYSKKGFVLSRIIKEVEAVYGIEVPLLSANITCNTIIKPAQSGLVHGL